jgi:WD40 repeat protein
MTDAFISYSRKDKEFVSVLYAAFERSRKNIWVDWNNIPLTSDWWAEIEKGIEAADTFVFVISPDSIASEVCAKEILHAVRHNKRLFPIVRRDATNFEVGNIAHDAIKKHNWLMFREEDDFESAFQNLIETISLDLDHLHRHTRLLLRAIEWSNGRSDSLLLRGDDLTSAEQWLAESEGKSPLPTELQETYIKNSRNVEDANERAIAILKDAERKAQSRIRVSTVVLAAALVLSLGASIWTKNSIDEANKQTRAATRSIITLHKTNAEIDLLQDRGFDSLLEAMRGYYKLKNVKEESGNPLGINRSDVIRALLQAVYESPAGNILEGHTAPIVSAEFSQDGTKIFTVSLDKTARIWNLKGQVIKTIDKHIEYPEHTRFNIENNRILTISKEKNWVVLNNEGNVIKELKDTILAQFSDDGSKIITRPSPNKNSMEVLDLQGNLVHEFKLPEDWNPDYDFAIQFNFDATKLIYPTKDNKFKVLDHKGSIVLEISGTRHQYFSKDGGKIITISNPDQDQDKDKEKKIIYDLAGNFSPLEIGRNEIKDFSLNHNSSKILTLTNFNKDGNQTVKLSNFRNNQIGETLIEFKVNNVSLIYFTEDDTKIFGYSNNNKIQIWDLKGNHIAEVKYEADKQPILNRDYSKFMIIDVNKLRLSAVSQKFITLSGKYRGNFSRDINLVLSYSGDDDQNNQTVQLFDLQGNQISKPFEIESIYNTSISDDAKKIAIQNDKKQRTQIIDFSGKLNADIEGIYTTFNRDGTRIATRLGNKILLWDAQGNRVGKDIETGLNESELRDVNFSSDGSKLIVIADKQLQIWDLETRQVIKRDIKRAFSSNYSNIIITVDDSGVVKLLDLKGNLIKEINVKLTNSDYPTFSSDEKYFLTVSGDADNKKAQIWDMKGNPVGVPKQNLRDILSARFSFNGKQLITFHKGNTVKIWDLTGALTTELKGHTQYLNTASISPDGNKIVTSSYSDKTIQIWNPAGNLIGIISSSSAVTFQAANFSADGSKIIAFTSDNKVRIYDNNFVTDYEQLWQLACKKLGDYLTYNPKVTEEDRKMCGIAAKGS